MSITDAGDGEALADTYTLTISNVAGGTCDVGVNTISPNNPYKGRVANNVAIDGVTIYRNIIPGVNLVFSVTTANGNVATVNVGLYLDTFDAFGAGAGVPGAVTRHRIVNTGTGPVSNAQASLKTHAIMVKQIGNALAAIRPFADGATEKEDGGTTQTLPYNLVISGVAGAGAGKTADLAVDGVQVPAAQLTDLNTGIDVSGNDLKAVAGQWYRFKAPHTLAGLEIALDPNCADGDEANVLIFAARHIQITDEVGGAPNAANWGVAPVVLTQAGQSAGVIQAAGEAFYYTRVVVPSGASAQKNPHPADVALTATETGSAGWFG